MANAIQTVHGCEQQSRVNIRVIFRLFQNLVVYLDFVFE